MRKYAVLALGLLWCSLGVAQEGLRAQTAAALEAFQPTAIEVGEGVLVAVPQTTVSVLQYRTMIGEFCYLQWSGVADLSGVKSFSVVNQSKIQGYVFDNPARNCADLGAVNGEQADAVILSGSREY